MNRLAFCRTLFEETRWMNINIRGALASVIEKHGLSQVQALLLGDLRSEDGQPLAQLAAHMQVAPSNFTPLARTLEEKGLIQRKQDERDKRSYRIFLTEEGRRTSEAIDEEFSQMFGGDSQRSEALQAKVLEGFSAFRELVELSRQRP